VRNMLGIECEGEDSCTNYHLSFFVHLADLVILDETMMTIHFSADLRPVVGERVGMLHWVLDPATSGFVIGYDLSDNQVIISNFDVWGLLTTFSVSLTNTLTVQEAPCRFVDNRTCTQCSDCSDWQRGSLRPAKLQALGA
jgi:hypothetical protein